MLKYCKVLQHYLMLLTDELELYTILAQTNTLKNLQGSDTQYGVHLLTDVVHHFIISAWYVYFSDDSWLEFVHQLAQNYAIA